LVWWAQSSACSSAYCAAREPEATEYLLAGTVLKPRREHSVRVLLLMLALQLLQVSL